MNDYQLEDAENAAVNKSQNLKRGLAVGGGVVAAGAGAAFAATQMTGDGATEGADLTADDILAGAQAAADAAGESTDATNATAQPAAQTHVHHTDSHVHIHHHPTPGPNAPTVQGEPNVEVQESSLLYDENGNYIGAVEEGVVDGKNFKIIDTDGNGKGDLIGIDENGNGIYEDNEISYMDNESYEVGKGKMVSIYQTDENGDPVLVTRGPHDQIIPEVAVVEHPENGDDINNIHNDFDDEKTGEVYRDDLAENNPDYNNHAEDNLYTASMDNHATEDPGYITPEIEAVAVDNYDYDTPDLASNNVDYGYSEPAVEATPDYAYSEPAVESTPDYSYSEPAVDTTPDYGYTDHSADYASNDFDAGGMDDYSSFDA